MAKSRKPKKQKINLLTILIAVALLLVVGYFIYMKVLASLKSTENNVKAANTTGFDQYGYNYAARIFNGTGESWAQAKGLPANYMGIYSKDKLVMKWNEEWDRGNSENWMKPPYSAWEDNEWNGKVKGGSGQNWHYKISWVGKCGADYTQLSNGGYCIWGQFEVIMDHGTDPNIGPGHQWFAKAAPAGYGAYKK